MCVCVCVCARIHVCAFVRACVHLVEVDDGEAVGLSGTHVPHREEEPLCVLLGVQVKPQVQLIVPPTTIYGGDTCVESSWTH